MASDERHHPTRLINPLGMRVLVRLLPRDERSKAGLYLPANVTEEGTDALYGEVRTPQFGVPPLKDSKRSAI